MDIIEIYSNLCIRDKRNPDHNYIYEDDEIPIPRKDCFCDSCFRGNDKLALEIIRLKEQNDKTQSFKKR